MVVSVTVHPGKPSRLTKDEAEILGGRRARTVLDFPLTLGLERQNNGKHGKQIKAVRDTAKPPRKRQLSPLFLETGAVVAVAIGALDVTRGG